MTGTFGIVAFVVALLVSIMLHEAGHFLMARRYGMKATEFFVGFGPRLFSHRHGETEYGVKAIPAGGYVKIVGMTPLEEVDPADEGRAFYKQPAPKRAVVLAAGSIVHFIIAAVLIVGGTFAIGGVSDDAPIVGDSVASLPVSAGSTDTVPAPAAGVLERGDRVLSVGGQPVDAWLDFVTAVRGSPGEALAVDVERDGERRSVSLTPIRVSRPDLDDRERTVEVGAVGVSQYVVTERLSPGAALEASGDNLLSLVTGTWETLTTRLDSITKLYSDDRDPQGLTGVVGASRISGEIAGLEQLSPGVRLLSFLFLLAGLNFFIGVFNLLPLLPLDGGHLAVLGFEQTRDRLKRLRGYRGPVQRVDLTKLLPVTYVVVLLFAGITVFILGADIVNPIRVTD